MVHVIRLSRAGHPDQYVKDEWSLTDDINHARIALNDASVTALTRRWTRFNASNDFTWCHSNNVITAVPVAVIPL